MDKKAPPALISRRKFILLSLGTAASLSLPAILASCAPAPTATTTPGATTPPSPTLVPPTLTAGLTLTPSATPGAAITQPKVITSVGNLLDTAFVVKMKDHTLPGQTTSISLRTYGSPKAGISAPNPDNDGDWDWTFPGPTLRIKPGDRVKIALHNRLPILPGDPMACNAVPTVIPVTPATPENAATPSATPLISLPTPNPTTDFDNCFHGDNVTNMHFHGFHVEQNENPDGTFGDDVLLALYPQGQQPPESAMHDGMNNETGTVHFDFVVPQSQARGTHWYHPHSHGSTDLQVANGMAGAFIVEDTLNDLFPDAKPVEYVFVIQDIAPTVNFNSGSAAIIGGPAPTTLINGEVTPNVPMKAGEVQRWRLINATGKGSNLYSVNFDGGDSGATPPEIYLISADGIFIDNDTWNNESPVTGIYLAPGNRADFLVKAVDEGTFSLNATSVQTQKPGSGGGGGGGAGGGGKNTGATATAAPDAPKAVTILSTTVSSTQTSSMKLPETLPSNPDVLRPFTPGEKIAKTDTVAFSIQPGTAQGNAPVFLIDGKRFSPCVVDHVMVLDTAEEWTLTNTSTLAHPFHIHLNPFYIKEYFDPQGGLPDVSGRWQDTIMIPAATFNADGSVKQAGKVVILHRFPEIVGKYVLHCHILGHEDRGMMQLVEVVATQAEATAIAAATPAGHCQ